MPTCAAWRPSASPTVHPNSPSPTANAPCWPRGARCISSRASRSPTRASRCSGIAGAIWWKDWGTAPPAIPRATAWARRVRPNR
ncbi:hypothetical protein G6F23_014903 [Rhizopus arrhizus]|nr:hypothetical protein G6F23_014903 [Rhizopus arrhizus]